jgi:hypothetical protein
LNFCIMHAGYDITKQGITVAYRLLLGNGLLSVFIVDWQAVKVRSKSGSHSASPLSNVRPPLLAKNHKTKHIKITHFIFTCIHIVTGTWVLCIPVQQLYVPIQGIKIHVAS